MIFEFWTLAISTFIFAAAFIFCEAERRRVNKACAVRLAKYRMGVE